MLRPIYAISQDADQKPAKSGTRNIGQNTDACLNLHLLRLVLRAGPTTGDGGLRDANLLFGLTYGVIEILHGFLPPGKCPYRQYGRDALSFHQELNFP